MKRRFFTILAGLSLLLFVGVVVLWVRSYTTDELFGYKWYRIEGDRVRWHFISCTSAAGGVCLLYQSHSRLGERAIRSAPEDRTRGWHWLTILPGPLKYPYFGSDSGSNASRRMWGFEVYADSMDGYGYIGGASNTSLVMPYWFLTLVFAIAPGIWLCALGRRILRARRGCCTACGYDLRASTERCPECGTANPSPSSAM